MTHHHNVLLHRVAETLGWHGKIPPDSKTQQTHSIQQSPYEKPCFATDKIFCCGKDCRWREDCRAVQAVRLS